MGPEAYVVAGAFSGMLASGLTTPMDVVKTKVTAADPSSLEPKLAAPVGL